MSAPRRRTRRRTRPHAAAGLAAFALLLAARPAAPGTWVRADIQVEILSRVLESDQALGSRAGNPVTIALLLQEGRPSSRNLELLEAFRSLEGRLLQGLDVSVVQRAYRGEHDLAVWLREQSVDLVYVDPSLAVRAAEIGSQCRAAKIVAVTAERRLVEQGFAVGIVSRRNRPHVVVNVAAAETVGLELEQSVLERFELLR